MLFKEYMKRIYNYMKLLGVSINVVCSDEAISQWETGWKFYVQQFLFLLFITQNFIWLFFLIKTNDVLEITYLMPIVTYFVLGVFRITSFMSNINNVITVIDILKKLDSKMDYDDIKKKKLRHVKFVVSLLLYNTIVAAVGFGLGPLIMTFWYIYSTGVTKLFLPFITWYPFNVYDMRFWPFAYFHQIWSLSVGVLCVCGPDSYFFTCCTFIVIHFSQLHRDIEGIATEDFLSRNIHNSEMFRKQIVFLVDRHRELIRCVDLVEKIYSKSTLFNVLTASLNICIAGFNVLVFRNYVITATYLCSLIYELLQVYFYCYYGDNVMASSMAVGNAVYNSYWYKLDVKDRKYLMFMLTRSEEPCKFTAYGFVDINMTTFTQILSKSWSYFALLNQVYEQKE